MTRPIITNQPTPMNAVGNPDKSMQQPPSEAPAHPPSVPKDTLAGAFPDWDLVPVTQFVRRIK